MTADTDKARRLGPNGSKGSADAGDIGGAEIGKIDAAGRQLTEAIRLWLEGGDGLAVHTLTMAAFGILDGLSRKDAEHGAFMDDFLSKDGHRRFRETANFLKHADRDPDATIREPAITQNEYRIGLCLVMYRRLSGGLAPEMGAFHLMSLMTYPDNFRVAADPDPDFEYFARYGAELARKDASLRRMLVQATLTLMKSGKMSPNVNVRRA